MKVNSQLSNVKESTKIIKIIIMIIVLIAIILIIIIIKPLFQDDNIFGTNASLKYDSQIQR